ncbi:hypothetical protein KC878_01425 [Candidatus Saccharibacteria bacterium]|nr:hypothetical protein [Candidatus Saccharibacteria bacterium]MCB9821186.1 hypothetical protein [Candidatus Nomurabacteria bacterium]
MEVPYNLHFEPSCEEVVLIAPGSSGGMKQSLIRAVFERAVEQRLTVLAFDYPYYYRGDEQPSSQLREEVEAMAEATDLLSEAGAKSLHIIGKSLGGVVASILLRHTRQMEREADKLGEITEPDGPWSSLSDRVRLTVMGFVMPDITIEDLAAYRVDIIQGQFDRFANVMDIRDMLDNADRPDIGVTEVVGADHSFRDSSGDDIYVQAAVNLIEW